ncbi:MAG: M23 family metallopeptidase [Reyranellaceae bacterium]
MATSPYCDTTTANIRFMATWRRGPELEAGQQLNAGDVIGTMGETGHVTGRHLHFEIAVGRGPDNYWAEPRWKYRKNPLLEVPAFRDQYGEAELLKQKDRWIGAIAKKTGLTKQKVVEALIETGALPASELNV